MRSVHNDGTQNDPPIRNLNASYRCFPAKPFHRFPPNYPASVSALGYRICNRDWSNLDRVKIAPSLGNLQVAHTPAWQMVKLFS